MAWDRWHWVARLDWFRRRRLDWFRRRRDACDAAPLLRGRRGTWWHPPWFHVAGVAQPHLCVAGVAQPHIHLRFAWQAWQNSRPPSFCVAGVAQPHIHLRFAWQAWQNSRPPSFCVAGVAQTHIYRRFAWQAWHSWHWVARRRHDRFCFLHADFHHVVHCSQPHIYRRFAWQAWDRWHWVARLDWFRRRRDACDAALLLRGRRGTWWHPPWFHVAGVAQPHIFRRFAWQAWDRWHWVARLDWFRRRRDAAPLLRGRRSTWWHLPWFHVAGVAQPHIYRRFAWQAWDRWHWVARLDWFRRRCDARDAAPLLRGRRGTWWHPPWFHVAGVAQPHIYRRFAWPAWDRWHWVARLDWFRRRRDARDAAPLLRGSRGTWWHPPWFHVAGVAQPHIYRRFAWQAWNRWHWVARLDWFRRRRDARDAAPLLRGSRGTWWHPPWFHVAGVAQPHIYRRFAWQAWDRWHWVARLDWFRRRRDARDAAPLLRGRRGTWWHSLSFCVAGVAQSHMRGQARHLVTYTWTRVAGVAQLHIHGRFAWEAWDRWHWVARLDWFRRPWRPWRRATSAWL